MAFVIRVLNEDGEPVDSVSLVLMFNGNDRREAFTNDQGEVRIPRVDTVLDAGLIVNPEATRAQFEGAAVFGASIVRSGEITAKNGVIQQSNFNDYPVARITEAPYQTNGHIVETSAPPAGVGEPGVPPPGPREAARWSPRRGRVSLAEWPYA